MEGPCPQFDDNDFEKILAWATGVKVVYSDSFKDGDGHERHIPEEASWQLIWEKGFISFDGIPKDREDKARKAAALFIYLWVKGVSADIAERCANAYVLTFEVTRA